jgi:hypothetical protein
MFEQVTAKVQIERIKMIRVIQHPGQLEDWGYTMRSTGALNMSIFLKPLHTVSPT